MKDGGENNKLSRVAICKLQSQHPFSKLPRKFHLLHAILIQFLQPIFPRVQKKTNLFLFSLSSYINLFTTWYLWDFFHGRLNSHSLWLLSFIFTKTTHHLYLLRNKKSARLVELFSKLKIIKIEEENRSSSRFFFRFVSVNDRFFRPNFMSMFRVACLFLARGYMPPKRCFVGSG